MAITGADEETLLVDLSMVGEKLSVTATAANGNEFDSEATDPVKADKAGVFELVDDQGFQDDGTALTTDTLRVSYGSDLGTPRHVTWYNDGAVMAVWTLDANSLTQDAFNSDACRSKAYNAVTKTYDELATGDWKVTIENTEGYLWESNEVTVVYYGEAIMSDVSIEDDYDTANMAGVSLAKTTGTAILNVTFNKNYAGSLYLIDSKIEKGYTGHDGNKIDLGAGGGGDIESTLKEVKTITQLTNKNASLAANAPGIYWEDPTGAVHCKLPVALTAGQTVTRGSSYYLVWDQDNNDADDLKAATSKREDLNASDDMEVPYVIAPDSIAVSSFATGATSVKVDLLDANGEKLAWYTGATNLDTAGLGSAKIFKVDTNAKDSSDSFVNAATASSKDGTLTLGAGGAINNAYVYVKLATKAGIFAKDSLTLESDLSESARDALTSMSLEEDSTTPTSAVVKFKGLSTKAPGKVYIMQGNLATESLKAADTGAEGAAKGDTDQATAYGLIAAHDLSDAIAEADVEGGASSVTIPNVFEAADMENPSVTAGTTDAYGKDMGNDAFVAVFVPEDEELWKRADSRALNAAGTDLLGFQLKPVITTIDKSELTATLTSSAALANATGPVITISGIQAMDQFGNKWVGAARTTDTASVSKNNSTVTNTENAAATTTTSVAGVVSIAVTLEEASGTTTATWDKGDGVTVKVPALKNLEVTISAKGVLTADTNSLIKDGAGTAAGKVAVDATLTAAGTDTTKGTLKLSDALSIS